MATIVKNETVETLAHIGDVRFEAFQDVRGSYWHTHYGRTHSQNFAFEVGDRRYWGEVTRTFDKKAPMGERTTYSVEIRTLGKDGFGRAIREGAKSLWRLDLRVAFKSHLEAHLQAMEAAA